MEIFFIVPLIPLIGGVFTLINHFRHENTNLLTNVFSGLLLLIAIAMFFSVKHPYSTEIMFYHNKDRSFPLELLIDKLTVTMLLLISFISFVVHQYATRYLRSDITQGRFMGQLSLLTASVVLLVMSGNLLTAFMGWEFISLTLYLLLNHYHYDSNANRAAKKKFVINRIGDLSFLCAVALCYFYFRTSEFSLLSSQPRIIMNLGVHSISVQSVVILLIFVAVMTKSAQFPFHLWLPDTMQTPTPVSAMMHAGIINSGGFLLARMSEFIVTGPWISNIIFTVGMLSVIVAAFFVITQNDVKRQLAYSTMGQMGYMLVQSGLGLYTAAVFHLIAHGFFKAYLFLSSGSNLGATHYNTRAVDKLKYAISAITISIVTFLIYFSYLYLYAHLNSSDIVVGIFIAITVGQYMAEIIILEQSITRKLTVYIVSLSLMFIYLGLDNALEFNLSGAVNNYTLEFSAYKITFALLAFTLQCTVWLHVLYAKSISSRTSLYIYHLSQNKLFIEEILRKYILQPFCALALRLNSLFCTRGVRTTLVLKSVIAFTVVYSLTSILQVSFIHSFVPTSMNIGVFILTLIAAYKAPNVRILNYYLYVSQISLVNIGLGSTIIRMHELAIYQLINCTLIFLGIALICKYQTKALPRVVRDDNRLIWSSIYFTILIFLWIGFPFSASFITELGVILSLLKAGQVVFVFIVFIGFILLAMAILNALQVHVFNRNSHFLRNIRHLPPLGHLFLSICIAVNILSGIMPNILIDNISAIMGGFLK